MSSFLDKLTMELEKYDGNAAMKEQHPLTIPDIPWVSTGCPELDYNLKTFGVKPGIIEIIGESRAGKTTMGLGIIARYLRKYPDAVCIFMLSEQRIDTAYAARLGVDLKRVFRATSNFVEDLFFKTQNIIDKIVSTWKATKQPGKPKIILLWDSIQATNSRAELETFKENTATYKKSVEDGKQFKLKHAKMSDFASAAKICVKSIFAQLYEMDITFICLNHLRDAVGSPVPSKASSGGTWREYFSYLRLEMQRDKLAGAPYKIDNEEWGQVTTVKALKNDFGGYKKTKILLALGYGFCLSAEDIAFGVEKKIIKKESETKYSFMNGKLAWSSPRTFLALYRSENKLMKVLHEKIIQARHQEIKNELELE